MLKPLHNNVIVEQVVKERMTQSGILLSGKDDSPIYECVVRAVGPGLLTDNGSLKKPSVEVGQTVILNKYNRNTAVEHEGKTLLIVIDSDIMAVV